LYTYRASQGERKKAGWREEEIAFSENAESGEGKFQSLQKGEGTAFTNKKS